MPSRFKSRIAKKHMSTHTITLKDSKEVQGNSISMEKKVLPTNFLLAVQETNFLYSFTLSGFVALSTTCTLIIESNFKDEEFGNHALMMVTISGLYTIYGVVISVLLYGRKTDYLIEKYEEDESTEDNNEF
jgi:hypothetical protein